MKVKKLSAMILIVMFAMFTMNQGVLAETPSVGESNATVEFTPATDAPDIVDPTDPTEPFEPGEPNPEDPPTGNTGPLTLDYVSSIDFGVHEISNMTEVYESTSLKPFIQITDRRGTGAGWTVTAQMSSFLDEDASESLQGAEITLTNGQALSAVGLSAAPSSAQTVVLSADNVAANVISAAEDTGLGTWINRWFPSDLEAAENNNVTLEVPAATAMAGSHTATITWTLTDAPGQ